ncbi:SRPBCC domain-containing protein [Pseudonocardia sulfidoxydans]|uniref:SRPBCC domain-containing protein n=1 Tax=Pseudonocardia sulfidoxydans TaxID=54011 RepID=UPI00361C407E
MPGSRAGGRRNGAGRPTVTTTSEPLVVEFHVAAPPAHAFEVWTTRIATWWPQSHTISGDPASITMAPAVGGRVVETTHDATTYDWGEVATWAPPTRLGLRLRLFIDRDETSEVDIGFAADDAGTRIRLEQAGLDRLGPAGTPRRARVGAAWVSITTHFVVACEAGWAAQT